MALVNTEILPFTATAYHNGSFVPVSDADLRGKWSIVFFYPADFTFVCPTELGDLADHYAELQKMGVEVYSVSTDTHFTHKAWHDTSDTIGKITYPMIGDPSGVVTNNFGVMRPGVGLADRGTFLVDPQGVIQFMEVTAEGIGRNAAELLRKVVHNFKRQSTRRVQYTLRINPATGASQVVGTTPGSIFVGGASLPSAE